MALPDWCERLTKWCPMLFSHDMRSLYFTYTAFGTSRAIITLQNRRDQSQERSAGTRVSRREDSIEYRVGRLKHERVRVPRENLLPWAMQVMRYHAERKSVLEIEFTNEEGTGLGPTLEFYALVSAELQRKAHAMWITDDNDNNVERTVDIGHGLKEPGYYIQREGGLFPAPYPPAKADRISEHFRFLGCLLAKALQDNRLVDIPLSRPFLKLMCMGEVGSNLARHHVVEHNSGHISDDSDQDDTTPTEHEIPAPTSPRSRANSEVSDLSSPSWYHSILSDYDFKVIYPSMANFIEQLKDLAEHKAAILSDQSLSDEDKQTRVDNLCIRAPGGAECAIDDLCLDFTFSPSSSVYGYDLYELKENGSDIPVTIDNIEDYITLVTDYCLDSGIRLQMDSFRDGFNSVFPMEKLHSFSPSELATMLCGDQCPQWTREDIMHYTEPKLGFTKESPGFLRLVNVLIDMNADERKAFLQFTTGCSSLPPGGLSNLYPRLTIVKKTDSDDNTYPSVNTCVHYLKLPEYSSEAVLRERLKHATIEKGFHLN